MNAIEIKALSKSFRDFTLNNINLALPQGSIMGLVGENGAGKTTTLKLIMNSVAKDSGIVKVLGVDNESPDFPSLKDDIGVVLDEAYFPEVLSAKNVGAVMTGTYKNWDKDTYAAYLHRFKLSDDKQFKDYSRGMKMKLAIAVALSHSPKLLVLDEATSGLDPMIRDEILDIFNEFTRDETHSILISSHIVSDLEKICDYIAFLHNGRLVLCDEKDRILDKYALLKLSAKEFKTLPPEAVKGVKRGKWETEALVLREAVPSAFKAEHAALEDIILFLAKGEKY